MKYNETFANNEENLIKIVNKFNSLANKVRSEDVPLLSQDANEEAIHEVLEKVIDFAADYFGWHMYHTGMCCAGSPYDYKIEDVTGCAEMTKQQVIVMVKERLGINIVIVD